MKNLSDILAEMEKQGFELGRLYTDKDRPPFKTNLTEGKRWKVYIQGESEPFIIGGKNERDVKELAHQMTYPTKIKIKKIVREGKLTEGHTISFSKEEMTKLHKDGSIEKDGHTYVYQEGFGKK